MGYTTYFSGDLSIEPPLNADEISFLNDLAETRRMDRTKGPLYVKGSGYMGQEKDDDITNYNSPHPDQPGLWLHWRPSSDGTSLEWDGGEKFYHADDWMRYIIEDLLAPSAKSYIQQHINEDERLKSFTCDHVLNGTIYADGEESEDYWKIVVTDNDVQVLDGVIMYGDEEPTVGPDEVEAAIRSITGKTRVTVWTATVSDQPGQVHATVHGSEAKAFASLRENYAEELDADPETQEGRDKILQELNAEGVTVLVDRHEVEL